MTFDVAKFVGIEVIRLLGEHDVIEDQYTDHRTDFPVIFSAFHLIGDHFGLIVQDPLGHVFKVPDLNLNLDDFARGEGESDIEDAFFVLPPPAVKVWIGDEHSGVLLRVYAQNGRE